MIDDYRALIDSTLARLNDDPASASLGQSHEQPIAALLRWIADVASGTETAPATQLFPAARALLAVIFWPQPPDVPGLRAFYRDDPLGRMILRAKWRCVSPESLMTIEAAAARLGVIPATIWHWIFTDAIEFVQDEAENRFLVLGVDVERLAAQKQSDYDAEHVVPGDGGGMTRVAHGCMIVRHTPESASGDRGARRGG